MNAQNVIPEDALYGWHNHLAKFWQLLQFSLLVIAASPCQACTQDPF